jgi:biopolymer transport protein ExbD
MSMTHGSRQGPDAEINVTPLIDVLLVLLIVFMVILPHRNLGEAADIPLPPPPDLHELEPPRTVVVQVLDAGEGKQPELKINDEHIPWERLEERLRTIYAMRAEKVAFLKGDPNVDFQFVANAIDITHRAGVERVGLISNSTSAWR